MIGHIGHEGRNSASRNNVGFPHNSMILFCEAVLVYTCLTQKRSTEGDNNSLVDPLCHLTAAIQGVRLIRAQRIRGVVVMGWDVEGGVLAMWFFGAILKTLPSMTPLYRDLRWWQSSQFLLATASFGHVFSSFDQKESASIQNSKHIACSRAGCETCKRMHATSFWGLMLLCCFVHIVVACFAARDGLHGHHGGSHFPDPGK